MGDFVAAARDLRIEVILASDGRQPLEVLGGSRTLTIDFSRVEWSASRIVNLGSRPDAVIAVDDRGVMIAALASQMLGIPSNPSAAVRATRDKAAMRGLLSNTDVRQPSYALAARGEVVRVAAEIGYPCVVKPRGLSASRGVIRANGPSEAEKADSRIRDIVAEADGDPETSLLVEEFVSGPEVAVEGLLIDGVLTVLAFLDKPDPLEGPYFEETMFVTPSRHDPVIQDEMASVVQSATRTLGLVSGPVHAEVRIGRSGVVLVEVAARSIGGLCGRALTFGLLGESLESVIIRGALGLPGSGLDSAVKATGVMMLPIPVAGELVSIEGVPDVLALDGVTEFNQTIPNRKAVTPLPEGDRYLGFIFATGESPEDVERTLRLAHNGLTITITP